MVRHMHMSLDEIRNMDEFDFRVHLHMAMAFESMDRTGTVVNKAAESDIPPAFQKGRSDSFTKRKKFDPSNFNPEEWGSV